VPRTLLTLALAALLLGGCGPSADRASARGVTERFFAALGSGDGARACAELSQDTRSKLESQEQKPCREAITGLGLKGAPIAGVDVDMVKAFVRLANGDAAFLDEGKQGWELSAVGCKRQGTPNEHPYDCDVED
jgi:hypothetical protein